MFHGIVEKDISSFKSVVGEELSDESEISQTQHGCFYGGIVFCIGGRTFSILFGSVQRHLGAKRKGYYLLCMVLITISCIVVQKVVRDNTEDKEFRLDNPKHRMRNTGAFTIMAFVGLIIGYAMFLLAFTMLHLN